MPGGHRSRQNIGTNGSSGQLMALESKQLSTILSLQGTTTVFCEEDLNDFTGKAKLAGGRPEMQNIVNGLKVI